MRSDVARPALNSRRCARSYPTTRACTRVRACERGRKRRVRFRTTSLSLPFSPFLSLSLYHGSDPLKLTLTRPHRAESHVQPQCMSLPPIVFAVLLVPVLNNQAFPRQLHVHSRWVGVGGEAAAAGRPGGRGGGRSDRTCRPASRARGRRSPGDRGLGRPHRPGARQRCPPCPRPELPHRAQCRRAAWVDCGDPRGRSHCPSNVVWRGRRSVGGKNQRRFFVVDDRIPLARTARCKVELDRTRALMLNLAIASRPVNGTSAPRGGTHARLDESGCGGPCAAMLLWERGPIGLLLGQRSRTGGVGGCVGGWGGDGQWRQWEM